MRTFLKVIAFTLTERHCMDHVVEQLHRRNMRCWVHTDVIRGQETRGLPPCPRVPESLQALSRIGVAQLIVSARPANSLPFKERTAVSAIPSSSSSTKPKPRGLLVARSWMISTARVLNPCEVNHSASASSVFVKGIFPTNSLFKVTSEVFILNMSR